MPKLRNLKPVDSATIASMLSEIPRSVYVAPFREWEVTRTKTLERNENRKRTI